MLALVTAAYRLRQSPSRSASPAMILMVAAARIVSIRWDCSRADAMSLSSHRVRVAGWKAKAKASTRTSEAITTLASSGGWGLCT